MENVTYTAISKRTGLKFKKHTYVLSFYKAENGLIKGEALTYGYLDQSFKLGASRGWFVRPLSMDERDFLLSYDQVSGSVSLPLKKVLA